MPVPCVCDSGLSINPDGVTAEDLGGRDGREAMPCLALASFRKILWQLFQSSAPDGDVTGGVHWFSSKSKKTEAPDQDEDGARSRVWWQSQGSDLLLIPVALRFHRLERSEQ